MHEVPPLGRHMILDVWGESNSLPYWNMNEAAAALVSAAKMLELQFLLRDGITSVRDMDILEL